MRLAMVGMVVALLMAGPARAQEPAPPLLTCEEKNRVLTEYVGALRAARDAAEIALAAMRQQFSELKARAEAKPEPPKPAASSK